MARLLPDNEISKDDLRGYRIFVWSHDHPYPPHVHFGKGSRHSAWNLQTPECIYSGSFSSSDLAEQAKILHPYEDVIRSRWHEHWQRIRRQHNAD